MPTPLTKQIIRLRSSVPTAAPDLEDPAWRAWRRHVDAGRVGSRSSRTFEQRLRLMKNEIALFGRVVTRELGRF